MACARSAPCCPGLRELRGRDEEIAELRAQVAEVAELRARAARLEWALSRNSVNSSMPPSGDDAPGRTQAISWTQPVP
jgi:Family of unknown function (DUF6444)